MQYDESTDILQLQDLPEYGAGSVEPHMGHQTSWFSIWSDCLITVAAE
jgi:hypothetical protein